MAQRRGVSYFGCRFPRHVGPDMERLREQGFTYVVHTVSENDLRFYRETLPELFGLTREAGLEVHADPWGVARLFGGEAFSELLARKPEGRQVDNRGEPLPALCPREPEVLALVAAWMEAVAAAGAEVAFLDEPHLFIHRPGPDEEPRWSCRCPRCRAAFVERYGRPMPANRTPQVEAFRRATVQEFTERCAALARRAGLKVSLCVLPRELGGESAFPLEEAASLEGVDTLGTDPYWVQAGLPAESFVGETARRLAAAAQAGGKSAQLWIQSFRIPRGREREIHTAVAAARAAGIEDLAVWGVDACGHMGWIRPEDPQAVWAAVLEAFRS